MILALGFLAARGVFAVRGAPVPPLDAAELLPVPSEVLATYDKLAAQDPGEIYLYYLVMMQCKTASGMIFIVSVGAFVGRSMFFDPTGTALGTNT